MSYDLAIPVDGVPTVKAEFREQFRSLAEATDFDLVGRYGGVGDESFDNTSAINDAFAEMSVTAPLGHSRLVMRGRFVFDPSALSWPIDPSTESLRSVTLVVDGGLLVTTPLVLDAGQHVQGIGGYKTSQFGHGPVCNIQGGSTVGPVISMVGMSAGSSIKGAVINGGASTSPAMTLTGAQKILSHISIVRDSTHPDADCIRIENCFWVWLDHFDLQQRSQSTAYTIRLYNASPTIARHNAEIYIRDGVLSIRGIMVQATAGALTGTRIAQLARIVYENPETPLVTVDTNSAGGQFTYVIVEAVECADGMAAGIHSSGIYNPVYASFVECEYLEPVTSGDAPQAVYWRGQRIPDTYFQDGAPSKYYIQQPEQIYTNITSTLLP